MNMIVANRRKPNPYDVHVGARLRACRTLAGFSQERLGEAVSLSFQQIQKYEKGLNRIGASRLQQFAQILNVPPSYFFDGMPIDGSPQDTGDPLATVAGDIVATSDQSPVSRRQALELVRYFGAISDRQVREAIFKMVKTCADVTDEPAEEHA
jgi:transcriptional regulator with XRE-family HTH domain